MFLVTMTVVSMAKRSAAKDGTEPTVNKVSNKFV